MSLLNRLTGIQNQKSQAPEDQLNLQELDFLLRALKSTQIVGEQVEMFYILVTKLQSQYTNQQEFV